MRKYFLYISIVVVLLLVFSCRDEEEKVWGTVVFGANYHVIDCITYVDIYVEGKHRGQLETWSDSVPNCNINNGLKLELEVGKHEYKAEIRPDSGTGCIADISGELNITKDGCETVFIDYYQVEWN